MPIIISRNGKNAKKIEKSVIEKEDYLQKYIYDNPGSIPLYDIKEDVKLLIVAREYPTQSGPIDALGIDGDGEIYVIETKLYKNPDKRYVVAQVLDYGASLWNTYTNYEDFLSLIDKGIEKEFNVGTNDKLMETFQINEDELSVLYENIKSNLSEGNYKFVVLMDRLHDRLKDLIIYLNQNSQFDIYAVEMEYYNYNELEILIPKIFGTEVKKETVDRAAGKKIPWTEERLFKELKLKLDDIQLVAVRRLYDYTKSVEADEKWGTGTRYGTFNPIFSNLNYKCPYSIKSNGSLDLHFDILVGDEMIESKRGAFINEMSKIRDFSIDEDDRWKILTIDKWASHVDEVIEIIEKTFLVDEHVSAKKKMTDDCITRCPDCNGELELVRSEKKKQFTGVRMISVPFNVFKCVRCGKEIKEMEPAFRKTYEKT